MHKSLFVVPAAVVALLAGAGSVHAKPVMADLRIEAGGDSQDEPALGESLEDRRFVTDTATLDTDTRPACGGSGKPKTLQGPTAMGILTNALALNTFLRPLGISDKFPFGLTVCGMGQYVGFESNQFWLYKVNHKSPEVGGDKYTLKPGDDVLWYFSDGAKNQNTGDELAIEAPVRATPGREFTVKVWAYDFAGKRKPAAGAEVRGDTVQTTDANGEARLTIGKPKTTLLRARRGSDIPSPSVQVCSLRPSQCPARRGRAIIGTNRADRITGTAGFDTVSGRRGADRINVAGGWADVVDCGQGRDVVIADRRDRVARDCERVQRRR